MIKHSEKIIKYLFLALLFLVPLVLFHKTSEVFEFNKMVLTYLFASLIATFWLLRMIYRKKVIFRKTILDKFLIFFLITQLISTILSIDPRTSFFGYYSRFHGGFLSIITYSFLYWAFVSNMDRKSTLQSIYITLFSSSLVAIYAILEHFGIDKDLWVQDVQSRVFSTLGQPNWLAAWIVSIIPVSVILFIYDKRKYKNISFKYIWYLTFSLLFFALIYTRSRSGFLGFSVSIVLLYLFVVYDFFKNKNKKVLIFSVISGVSFISYVIISGSPWSEPIVSYIKVGSSDSTTVNLQPTPSGDSQNEEQKIQGPALEVGGSDSARIRRIVWQGAINIWKAHPIIGTGVETFSFAYYKYRPLEHNLVSEWDFLYNKAHNEYLNYAATTGSLGLISYLALLIIILFQIKKGFSFKKNINNTNKLTPLLSNKIQVGLISGILSIAVTNFFGFSVVSVSLILFLYPAFSFSLNQKDTNKDKKGGIEDNKLLAIDSNQKIASFFAVLLGLTLLYLVGRYWYTDTVYAKGKTFNDIKNFTNGRQYLLKATTLSPNEPVYWDEMSIATANIAAALHFQGSTDLAVRYAQSAINEIAKAQDLNPSNVNYKRNMAAVYIILSNIDESYIIPARDALIKAVEEAPTEAKLIYNLGLTYAKTGDTQKAIEILKKTIEYKPNYKNAHLALGIIYKQEGEIELARQEFEYILKYIIPNDPDVLAELENLDD